MKQFGDAEVEQLDLTLLINKDVARLQIAVNDETLMRKVNGGTDRTKQIKPRVHVQRVTRGVSGDRFAVDKLHDQKRPAFGGAAAVNQSHDIRMIERCEYLSLGVEAFDQSRPATTLFAGARRFVWPTIRDYLVKQCGMALNPLQTAF